MHKTDEIKKAFGYVPKPFEVCGIADKLMSLINDATPLGIHIDVEFDGDGTFYRFRDSNAWDGIPDDAPQEVHAEADARYESDLRYDEILAGKTFKWLAPALNAMLVAHANMIDAYHEDGKRYPER